MIWDRLRDEHGIDLPFRDPVRSVGELLARMSEMDHVVTSRFHGMVLAHLLREPVIAVSPHPKVAALDADVLAEKFASLTEHREELQESMAKTLASFQAELAEQFDSLFARQPEARSLLAVQR